MKEKKTTKQIEKTTKKKNQRASLQKKNENEINTRTQSLSLSFQRYLKTLKTPSKFMAMTFLLQF